MKKMKKIMCLFLSGLMLLSLSGCTEKTNDGNSGVGKGSEKGGTVSVDTGSSKEYVYHGQDIDLGDEFEDMNLLTMSSLNDRIILVYEDHNHVAHNGAKTEIITSDISNDVIVDITPDMSVDEEIMPVFPEGELEEYGTPDYVWVSVKVDGSDKQTKVLQGAECMEAGWMNCFRVLSDGSLVGLHEVGIEDTSNPDMYVWKNVYSLVKWNSQGDLEWEKQIETGANDYLYAQAIVLDETGNILMFTESGSLFEFTSQGEQKSHEELGDLGIENVGQVVTKNGGGIYVTGFNNEWTKMYISEFDFATRTFGLKKELPGNFSSYNLFNGYSTDLVLANNIGVFTYNLGDAAPIKVMDYVNSDLESNYLNNISFVNEHEFVAIYNDTETWESKLARFTYVDPSELPDKETFVLGCNWLDSDLKKRVLEYNKASDKYRIILRDYSTYNTMEDYDMAYTKMNNDIISGKMPDVMVVQANQDIAGWVNKGLLADIGELIANDEELSKVEFLENVFKAYSVNDKLYTVVPSFAIQTMVGRKDVVGDRNGWTMSEFREFLQTMPEGVKPFGDDVLRDSVLSYIMQYCGNDFVDINTGNCSFDSPEFISMLEFAKTFPKDYEASYWEDYDWEYMQSQYRDKKAVLMNSYIYRISELIYTYHGSMGGEVAHVGFPGMKANSSVITSSITPMVISAKSKNIDAAWDFVRYYLTEEYQTSDYMYGLSVQKKVFEEQAKQAMERPHWTNEETGEKEYYDYTYWINEEEIVLDVFSQKEVDEICNFIYSVDKLSYYNQDIINIVIEEAESYFADTKKAEEVARIIQSRVQIYVDENR